MIKALSVPGFAPLNKAPVSYECKPILNNFFRTPFLIAHPIIDVLMADQASAETKHDYRHNTHVLACVRPGKLAIA